MCLSGLYSATFLTLSRLEKEQTAAATLRSLHHSASEMEFDQKSLLRKIDFHVMPILFVIYVAAFLDRWFAIFVLCDASIYFQLQSQHLKCPYNAPTKRARARRTAAEHRTHNILRTIYSFRDSIQRSDEKVPTAHMALVVLLVPLHR